MSRPRVALIVTTSLRRAHADTMGTRVIEGYPWEGSTIQSRVDVAGLYTERLSDVDIGMDTARRSNVPFYGSVAVPDAGLDQPVPEALTDA